MIKILNLKLKVKSMILITFKPDFLGKETANIYDFKLLRSQFISIIATGKFKNLM